MLDGSAEDIGDLLSLEQVRFAIASLTPDDEARLLSAAKLFCAVNALDEDPKALVREALTRALEGRRNCRRSLGFVPFLCGSMRSIAHSAAKSTRRSRIDFFAEPEEINEEELGEAATNLVTPERELAASEALQRLNDLFQDDGEILLLLYAMADGLKGNELRAELDWSETQLNTIRRRMMRKSKDLAQQWRKS